MKQWLIVCTITSVLPSIRPGAEWAMQDNDYNKLVWLDKTQSKPTLQEINTALTACQSAAPVKTLEQRIADLESKVTTLETKPSTTTVK